MSDSEVVDALEQSSCRDRGLDCEEWRGGRVRGGGGKVTVFRFVLGLGFEGRRGSMGGGGAKKGAPGG